MFVFVLYLQVFDGARLAGSVEMQLCRGAAVGAEEVPGDALPGPAAPQLEPTWRSNGGE